MSGLEFDELSHSYKLDGKPVVGVTSCISHIPEDLLFNQNFIDKTEIGSETHRICEIINLQIIHKEYLRAEWNDEYILSITTCFPERVLGYVNGYLKWLDDHLGKDLEIQEAESKFHSRKHRVAGTGDIVGIYQTFKAIIDIKTVNTMTPTVGLQLAAYKMMYNEMNEGNNKVGRIEKRWGLQLLPDEDYKMYAYVERTDERVFLCKKIAHEWDVRHNLD